MNNKNRIKDRLGDREEVRLGEQFYILKNYSFSRNEEDINGEIKHIHYGDIHTGLSSIIKNTVDIPTLNNEIEINLKDLINDNDLIIADASEDYQDLGKTIYIEKLNNDRVVAGLHTFHLRKKDKIEPKYFKYFTESINYKKQMYRSGTGTSVFGISKANLEQVIIPYINEINQIKISNFLSSIDILIEKQEEYIQKSKEKFKYDSNKLFNIGNKKIFFSDFLTKQINTLYVQNEVLYNQITISNNGKIKYRNQKLGKDIGRKRQFIIDLNLFPNTLTMIRQGIYNGGIGFITEQSLNGAIVTENMPLLTFNSNVIDKVYFSFYLKSIKFYKNVLFNLKPIGSAQSAIHEKDLLKQYDLFPSLNEQKKIADYLSSMDKLIELNEKKLEQLKLKKKYYLNEIFK